MATVSVKEPSAADRKIAIKDQDSTLLVDIDDIELPSDVVLCVGPEGGFAPDEFLEDVVRVRLGGNVLRVETAALVAAALLTHKSNS